LQQNKGRETALHYAAGLRRADVVEILLRQGANVNAVTNKLQTPLHYAVNFDLWRREPMGVVQRIIHVLAPNWPQDQLRCVQLLLEAKAKLDVKDGGMRTPLDIYKSMTQDRGVSWSSRFWGDSAGAEKQHPELVHLLDPYHDKDLNTTRTRHHRKRRSSKHRHRRRRRKRGRSR